MVFPQVKKRITDFICGEEGRISKQSLISVGAYLGSGIIASSLLSSRTAAQDGGPPDIPGTAPSVTESAPGSVPSTAGACDGNDDIDIESCAGPPSEPGAGCPIQNAEFSAVNAYNADGTQKFFGNGRCSDDAQRFHFNGVDFSYVGTSLTAEHHHHGSHNSY
jgi:hypothetical protein